MSFDSRFYQQAENELNERRLRNERVLAAHESEISKNSPDIIATQNQLAAAGAKVIELILNKDKDFERKFGELQQNNLFLQKTLREKLVRLGYPADYLEMPHSCEKCGDTGVINGRRCSCFTETVRRLAAEELNRSTPLRLCSFDDFMLSYYDDKQPTALGCTAREAMSENLRFCRKYAEDFHLPNSGVLMRGATGLGKTHLSLSIANEVIKKGYSVIYGSAPDLFRKIEQEHFGRTDGDTVGMMQEADLLILDDVGAEFESKFYTSALYGIINNRMNAGVPTIISTNCDLSELQSRYGDRIVSRLITFEQLIFVGNDVRILKQNGGI